MTLFPLLKTAARTAVALIASVSVAWSCTGIMLTGSDGSIIRARTAEWGPFDLETKINVIPRGYAYSAGEMPDGKQGATWTGRYGMVGISMLDHGAPADGINEAGLTAGLFYLPGFTEYQEYLPDQADNTIPGDLLASVVRRDLWHNGAGTSAQIQWEDAGTRWEELGRDGVSTGRMRESE